MNLAAKIKSLRKEAGLTQKELGTRMHMHPRLYENLERGRGITVSRVVSICNVLGVPYHEHFSTYEITGKSRDIADRSTDLDKGFRTRNTPWYPKGDTNLERFFRQYFITVKYNVLAIVSNKQVAEDIVIETFTKFSSSGTADDPDYKDGQKLSWLYSTSRNAAFNYLKQLKRRNDCSKDILSIYPIVTSNMIEGNIIRGELLQKIILSLDNVPEKRRNIFKKVYLENKSRKEVAAEMNITLDTIGVQISRTIHYLKDLFMEDYEYTLGFRQSIVGNPII